MTKRGQSRSDDSWWWTPRKRRKNGIMGSPRCQKVTETLWYMMRKNQFIHKMDGIHKLLRYTLRDVSWMAQQTGSTDLHDDALLSRSGRPLQQCEATDHCRRHQPGRAATTLIERHSPTIEQWASYMRRVQSQFIMYARVRSNGCELQRDIRYGTAPLPATEAPLCWHSLSLTVRMRAS